MDVYQIVTDRIIGLLEQGTVPWRKPWTSSDGMPKNLVSKKEYRGINLFLLGCQQYGSPYWLTYRQAVERNGNVRKGEKASLVVFWKLPQKQETGDKETPVTLEASVTSTKRHFQNNAPILKYYNLFNLEQCEGIVAPPSEVPSYQFTPIEKAGQIVSGMKGRPEITYGGNKASYSPITDKIRMPNEDRFEKNEEFYSVLYHELAHSSGAKHRLARKEVMEVNKFGSDPYASEELVAELTNSMLCGIAGISNQTIDLAASYIDGWLSVLRKDRKMVTVAAAQAQKAADYILGRKFGSEEEQHVL